MSAATTRRQSECASFRDGIPIGHAQPTDSQRFPRRDSRRPFEADRHERSSRTSSHQPCQARRLKRASFPDRIPIGHSKPADSSERSSRMGSHRPRSADRYERNSQTGFPSATPSRPTQASRPDGIRIGHAKPPDTREFPRRDSRRPSKPSDSSDFPAGIRMGRATSTDPSEVPRSVRIGQASHRFSPRAGSLSLRIGTSGALKRRSRSTPRLGPDRHSQPHPPSGNLSKSGCSFGAVGAVGFFEPLTGELQPLLGSREIGADSTDVGLFEKNRTL